ncbi:MAG: rod shape-determining protein MreD [Candidatus Doudnabacteria bacterium RIFCSPHIGHO2_01_FULL_50_11]|uniref:Rod shape-determining protein MreD n=1 Tax=Candidatus Doudnabacteria bacterium RIFCSPHIGHO2_01_FULL_50_11 TaxID=1817828 RepID=A0A1F5PNG7_9BACT|nr:MAG: rod shape-determining protein MreD [Candidatus Doudnabacteria bacterium RIFCSPHIGHO2_01_FULL_50_11]
MIRFRILISSIFLLLIQLSILPVVFPQGWAPSLILCQSLWLSYKGWSGWAISSAFLSGLFLDLYSGAPFGQQAASLLIVIGSLELLFRSVLPRDIGSFHPLVVAAIASIVVRIVSWATAAAISALQALPQPIISWYMNSTLIPLAVFTTIAMFGVRVAYGRFLPHKS